jgi:hypothetical protein
MAPPASRHRPAWSFSMIPSRASRRKRPPVTDRPAAAALANAITLRPGLSRMARKSFRSASSAAGGLRGRALALAVRGGMGIGA